jgi:hypothetical protein
MQMRTIRHAYWLALLVGALFYHLETAGAQVSPEAQQACTPDAMRLCSEFIPDVPKVTACMHAKRAQLSVACRTVMAGGGHEARRHHGRVHCGKHSRHCG